MHAVAGELVVVRATDEALLPRRQGGRATDRVAQLTALLVSLVGKDGAIDRLAFRKSLEARAPMSVKALANDISCYANFCARAGGIGLPANEARIVGYLEDCETRKLKPATVGRRLASLAVVHGLLGVASPTRGSIVRDALRGFRRRVDVTQRQAGPLRAGQRARQGVYPERAVAGMPWNIAWFARWGAAQPRLRHRVARVRTGAGGVRPYHSRTRWL
jgi:hypothetical protein